MMKSDPKEHNDFKNLIDESKADLSNYLETRLTLAKLNAYEKIARTSSFILYSLVVVFFVLIFFILSLIGIGITIGEIFDNYALGFGVLVLFIFLLIVIIVLSGKSLKRSFINLTLRIIKKIEKNEY